MSREAIRRAKARLKRTVHVLSKMAFARSMRRVSRAFKAKTVALRRITRSASE